MLVLIVWGIVWKCRGTHKMYYTQSISAPLKSFQTDFVMRKGTYANSKTSSKQLCSSQNNRYWQHFIALCLAGVNDGLMTSQRIWPVSPLQCLLTGPGPPLGPESQSRVQSSGLRPSSPLLPHPDPHPPTQFNITPTWKLLCGHWIYNTALIYCIFISSLQYSRQVISYRQISW